MNPRKKIVEWSGKKARLSSLVYYPCNLLLTLLLSTLTPLLAQDTLSFGGIYDLPGAEVRATYTPVSPLAQSFTIEEVYRLPGTFYDPARLVALLPGVVQTNDQANHLSVRGNTPNANLWRLNGLAIVNPNHTANAGTFYDFPTLSGGGVNAISAQMLGNSGFLAGGLPVEYGYATGGTFDLRLRPGSKTKRKYQAQAGFIGFDLMAEGPIGSSGKTSYLVNGRYSFTGLLADMGVDFGGEEIRFADLNAHLHHEWDGGEVSLFTIVGASSNVFAGPDSTEQEITRQKELFDIDFESTVQVYGVNAAFQAGGGTVQAAFGTSRVSTDRAQGLPGQRAFLDQSLNYDYLNGNLQYVRTIEKVELRAGIEFFRQNGTYDNDVERGGGGRLRLFETPTITSYSPFTSYTRTGERSDLALGLRGTLYNGNIDEFVFEPRLNYQLRTGLGRLTVQADRISQTSFAQLLSLDSPFEENFARVSNNFSLGYQRTFGSITTRLKGYFEYTGKDYASDDGAFLVSANNALELDPFTVATATLTTATRRYGLELEAAGGRKTEGWYYRGSLTLLNAETEQRNGNWTKDRYSVDFIAKLTLGREWNGQDKKQRDRVYGLNLALIGHGGERYGMLVPPRPALIQSPAGLYFAPQDLSSGYINQLNTYFRPDLRLYKTKTRKKTTTTLALDVQNATNVRNVANVYYDAFLERPNERFQLGIIPVLSYRIVWR